MTIKKMLGFPQNLKSSFVLHVTTFMENFVAFNEQVHKLKWLKSQKLPPPKKNCENATFTSLNINFF